MALRSPHKLLMEAKTILDDSMETGKTSAMVTENKTDRVSLSDKDPQERRPGLGLKQAKFSMKPRPSQPDVVSEPTLDIAKLKDPVEFFAAFEKIENAKKEMQRLKGQQVPVLNFDPNISRLSPRPRRPSLYGKSATYKHRSYASKMVDDNGEASQPSQKTSEKHKASPMSQYALPETDVDINSRHTKVSGSTPAMTSEQNEFDELMSLDYGGLDEAELLDIVQEKLQIKLKDFDKPAPPDLLHVPRREPETCDALSKMEDYIARLKNIRKTAGSENLSVSSQHRKSSVYSQVAPVQSKSPLASISLLSRHISKLSPPKDPFSGLDIDLPPARIPSSKTVHGAQLDKIDTRKDVYESGTSLMHAEENSAAASNPTVLEKNITARSSEPKKQSYVVIPSDHDGGGKDLHVHSTSAAHGDETTSLPSVFSPSLEQNNISTTSGQKESSDAVTRSGQVAEKIVVCDFSKSPAPREQSVVNAGEASLDFESRGVDPSSENMEQEDEVSAENNYVHVELDNEGCSTEKSNVNGVGESTISKNADDIDMEVPNKEAAEPSKRKSGKQRKSKVAVEKAGEKNAHANVPLLEKTTNRKRKAQEAPRASKRERASRRNSLFAAGTVTENGRRRSTRIKMRPLEYWKGERFLYGRIHDSLVTVIGVKYASPSKDGDQIKVKSFVSDEYKDLVDLVALH